MFIHRFHIVALLTLLVVPTPSPSQKKAITPQTEFDVASIKASNPDASGFAIRPGQNTFSVTGGPLRFLLAYAYGVHEFQIEGLPHWANAAKFDIVAKVLEPSEIAPRTTATAGSPSDTRKLMQLRLQSLLSSRFKLEVHRGEKVLPVYALQVTEGGAKLQPAGKNTGYVSGPGRIQCSDLTMNDLAFILSDSLDSIVLDHTHLIGGYAFSLKWNPHELSGPSDSVPGLPTALKEQLGLRLVSTKGPVPTVVVDQINRPSPN